MNIIDNQTISAWTDALHAKEVMTTRILIRS